jgi:hypothetical protein
VNFSEITQKKIAVSNIIAMDETAVWFDRFGPQSWGEVNYM